MLPGAVSFARAVNHHAFGAEPPLQFADKRPLRAVFQVIVQGKRHALRLKPERHRVQRRNTDPGRQQRHPLRCAYRKQIARGRNQQRLAGAQLLMDIARAAA